MPASHSLCAESFCASLQLNDVLAQPGPRVVWHACSALSRRDHELRPRRHRVAFRRQRLTTDCHCRRQRQNYAATNQPGHLVIAPTLSPGAPPLACEPEPPATERCAQLSAQEQARGGSKRSWLT